MVLIRRATLILALTLAVAGCTTTDGMTPPAPVGAETQSLAAETSAYGADSTNDVAGTNAFPAAPTGATVQTSAGFEQNSLDAQARSLAAGNGPMQPPPPVYAATTGQGTNQQASLRQQASAQPMPPPPAAPAATASAPAPAAGGATVRFLPIIGAPVEAVTPLSRQLGAEARANGLTIKGSSDPASEHILKGYFSAFSDEGKVNVVYVWDVLDAAGSRLHRIQGQETFSSAAADPWASVPPQLMQQIATKTIAEYMTWRRGSPG